MKNIIKLSFIMLATLGMLAGIFVTKNTVAGHARDFDSNAVLYGGAYSTAELRNKITGGTGKQYQSAAQLKTLYNHYGIYTEDFGHLLSGRVTKNSQVLIGNKVVAENVYSLGRQYMKGSIREGWTNYPLYRRHPQVSFVSESINAFVYLNYDGSMAYAVIKSCGNVVPGVGKRKAPEVKHSLTIKKFEDRNGNGRKDCDESYLSGWKFRVRGNGLDTNVTTQANGSVVISGLKSAVYVIDEYSQPNWKFITNPHQVVTINCQDKTVLFGNQRIPEKMEKVSVRIVKFNDENGNKKQDESEKNLNGWSFSVEGPDLAKTVTTSIDGQALLSDLQPGYYTVTEIQKDGWTNTTGLTITKKVTQSPESQLFVFGNKRKLKEITQTQGGGETKKQTKVSVLPVTGTAETATGGMGFISMASMSIAWLKSKRNLLKSQKK